ncbi:MAG TPA: hypothetical protein DEF42_17910 [Desulfosporosinus sp.]|nr:hypothetical protein [Desulfosporosinus sp.]
MAIGRVLKDEDSSKIVLDYIMNPNKTDLVTGVNCVPETAFEEMLMVKAAYNKQEGRQFIHFVQSFHPAEQVTPEQIHEIGVRLVKEFERFSGFQIVVSTHLDREHLHNHFVFNTVNMETGLKWQQSPRQMQQLKDFSDELCKDHDLTIIEHKGSQRESTGEHRSKKREQSWMHELRLAVDAFKKTSTSRADFISNMQKIGYQVKWTDTRKDITFTTPDGKKCRNLRLDKDLTKESLQEAFRLNKEFGNPRDMTRQIGQLELATKVAKMMPLENEVIVEQTIESEDRNGQGEREINDALIISEGNEFKNRIEQDPVVGDVLDEDESNEEVIDDLQEMAYIMEWSDRYKEARTLLYGSKEVEQNLSEAYRLFLEETQIGNALALHDLGRMHMDGLGVEMNPDIAQDLYSKALTAFQAVEMEKPRPYPQYRIGKMYVAGLGTPQNYEVAAEWFEMAVAKNHKYAQYSLAGLYYRGQGVEQSYTTAFSLYGKSAAQENPYASYELAKMYRNGIGCNKDTEKADQYFKNAFVGFSAIEADSHDDKLQYRLGQMLYMGTGTEKDAVKAVDYLEQSAKQGNANAQYLLAKIYLEADNGLKNVEWALEWLGKAAENDNTQAQYALGKLYRDGNHVEKDIIKAVELFKLSAEQENQFAQYALGKLYLFGEEIPKDVEAAVKWLSASAEQENSFAQYTLGKLYVEGKDVPKDVETGLKLLTASADQGNPYASYELGKMYRDGLGCNKDTEKADQYFKNAFMGFAELEADSHDDKLQYRLGQMLYTGTGTEKDAVKAVDCLERSAKLGNSNAQYLLAKIYLEANSGLENVERALEWLGKAAENGNAQAQYALGKLYRDGNHVEKDIVKAVALFKLSVEQENQFAQYALGKLYLFGEEIPKDVAAAVKWLSASAEQENNFARYTLGKLYVEGKDVPKDIEAGLRLLTVSAEQGNQFAQFQLGKIYLSGKEVERDKAMAIHWLSLSAAQGNEYAQLLLEKMDSYNATEIDFLLALMQFFSTQNRSQNQSHNYPLSHLEGHALREKILELQFGRSMNWARGQGYER